MALNNDKEFDPNFGIPYGLRGGTLYVDQNAIDNPASDETDDVLEIADFEIVDVPGDDEFLAETEADLPMPPDAIVVLAQNIRTAGDGTQVIDVVIEVDDHKNTTYDVKATPI